MYFGLVVRFHFAQSGILQRQSFSFHVQKGFTCLNSGFIIKYVSFYHFIQSNCNVFELSAYNVQSLALNKLGKKRPMMCVCVCECKSIYLYVGRFGNLFHVDEVWHILMISNPCSMLHCVRLMCACA